MTFQTLASIDLTACSKAQLKTFVKLARDEWGRAIDLRSANVHDLIEYLQMYLQFKAVAPETEVTTSKNAEIETVTYTPSDFEGIEPEVMERTDWLNATPLSCDICNYQVCDLSEEVIFCDGCEKRCELVAEELPKPVEIPESFNAIASRTIDILLQFGSGYGDIVNRAWIEGILKDCSWRATIPGSVTEKLVLSDAIFYGLAGIDSDSIALYQHVVKCPEEFLDMPEDVKGGANFYRNLGSLFGADKIAQIAAYHSIRDNLNYLQQRLNISSLEPRHYAIRDKLFTTIDYDQQMSLLPSDRATLELEAPKIAAYFQLLTTDYQLFRVYNDETEKPLSKDFDLARQASIADHAWIYAESFDWIRQSGGGYIGTHCDRLHPDRVELSLSFWNGSDYDSFLRLVAYHPDQTRRPWLASQSS